MSLGLATPQQCQQSAAPVRVPSQRSGDQSHALRGSLQEPRAAVQIGLVGGVSPLATKKRSQTTAPGDERDCYFFLQAHSAKTVESRDWSASRESALHIRRLVLGARGKTPPRHV